MADTATRVLPQYLAAATGVLFIVPAGKTWLIAGIVICNKDTVQRAVTLQHTSGGAPAAASELLSAVPILVNQSHEAGRGWIFAAGDKLYGFADAADKVVVTVYYAERA